MYYATRTHSQIAQVVRELKRTPYRPSMVVLGSREHYCVNEAARDAARRGGSIGDACKSLLESGAARGPDPLDSDRDRSAVTGGGGCGYSHGAVKLASTAGRPGSAPTDVEDLVALGAKTRGCPYFAAKHMSESAELIFCPYNYLLDPSVRAAMDVDLGGALVILDEAHNVEDTAREAASCDVALRDVVLAADEFARVAVAVSAGGGDDAAGGSTTPSDAAGGSTTPSSGRPLHSGGDFDFSGGDPSGDPFRLLAEVTGSVARWLAGASDRSNPRCPLRARGFEQWQATWSGRDAVAGRMRDAGLAPERVDLAREAVKRLTKEANDAKTPA